MRHVRNHRLVVFGVAVLLSLQAMAQQGDKPGEEQKSRVPKELIPPAPPLPPEQALQSFRLPPGFRIELVASEPMVDTPVAMTFDANGRIWVVEMRGLMPNVDGLGEQDIPGRIAVLEEFSSGETESYRGAEVGVLEDPAFFASCLSDGEFRHRCLAGAVSFECFERADLVCE